MNSPAMSANTGDYPRSSGTETKFSKKIYEENIPVSADALEVLKQDPAILDAQMSVDSNTDNGSLIDSTEPEILEKSANSPEIPAEEILTEEVSDTQRFEEMMRMQKAALLSLAPDKLNLLLGYAQVLRIQRHQIQQQTSFQECALCKKNGRPMSWYTSHVLKDSRGRVRCPVLRNFRCPVCGATGDRAHTLKYCPQHRYGDRWGR